MTLTAVCVFLFLISEFCDSVNTLLSEAHLVAAGTLGSSADFSLAFPLFKKICTSAPFRNSTMERAAWRWKEPCVASECCRQSLGGQLVFILDTHAPLPAEVLAG